MKERYQDWKSKIILFTKGLLMGGADIIPGVSGGTVALISGIYEHLILAISQVGFKEIRSMLLFPVFFFQKEKRAFHLEILGKIHWTFLITLALGILTGILSMSRIIPLAMEEYPFYTYALFFGLILVSVSIPFRMMDHRAPEFLVLMVATVVVYFLVGFSRVSDATVEIAEAPYVSSPTEQNSREIEPAPDHPVKAESFKTDAKGKLELHYSEQQLKNGLAGTVRTPDDSPLGNFRIELVQGIPAVTESSLEHASLFIRESKIKKVESADGTIIYSFEATITENGSRSIPFVFMSGALAISAMILPGISGAYILVILGQYRHVLEALHSLDVVFLITLVGGIAVGLFTFVRLLKYLLDRHHSMTMAALTGTMLGSLVKIWPGHYMAPEASGMEIGLGIAIAIAGGISILVLEMVSKKINDPDSP